MVRPLPNLDGPGPALLAGAARARSARPTLRQLFGMHGFRPHDSAPNAARMISEWMRSHPPGSSRPGACFTGPISTTCLCRTQSIQVRLECGVQLFSNPAGVEAGALRIGLPVEAVFEDIIARSDPVEVQAAEGRTMKAIVVHAPGGIDVLKTRTISDPTPGPKDVVIKVDACGVCFHDIVTRNGTLKFGVQMPCVLGHEISGDRGRDRP